MNYMQAIGCDEEVEITQEQFVKARNADEILNEFYAIESKFDFVVENYFELQKIILEKTLRNTMFCSRFSERYISEFFKNDRIINRVLFNFLSTAKLYIDQLTTSVGKINATFSVSVNEMVSDFRKCDVNHFVIFIRDFMQHEGVICSLSSGIKRRELKHNSETVWFHYQSMKLDKTKRSRRNKKGYSKLDFNNVSDVLTVIKQFYCNIYELHEKVRELIKTDKANTEDFMRTLYSLYTEKTGFDFSYSQELLEFYDSDSKRIVFTTNTMRFINELEEKNKFRNNMENIIVCNMNEEQLNEL